MVRHRTVDVGGTTIFYREVGAQDAPAVLLLHGFPSSSHQFRLLLPALADHYHVLAPGFPAFGFSACPNPSEYAYTFEHLADTIEDFTNKCGLTRYALYIHDYGAQIGFRLALRSPKRVAALVIQNSEAYYEDGRTQSWSAMEDYWRDPTPVKREALRCKLFTEEGIRREFVEHLPPDIVELIDPTVMTLASAQITRPQATEALLNLHLDYRNNVALYPQFQAYLRQHKPPALIIWGREDQYCTPAAADAYKRDLPDAEIRIIDGGQWALESHGPEVIRLTRDFLDRRHYSAAANLFAA